jgi:hypothetical protein
LGWLFDANSKLIPKAMNSRPNLFLKDFTGDLPLVNNAIAGTTTLCLLNPPQNAKSLPPSLGSEEGLLKFPRHQSPQKA